MLAIQHALHGYHVHHALLGVIFYKHVILVNSPYQTNCVNGKKGQINQVCVLQNQILFKVLNLKNP